MSDEERWTEADDVMAHLHGRDKRHPGTCALRFMAAIVTGPPDADLYPQVTPTARSTIDFGNLRDLLASIPDVALGSGARSITEQRDVALVRILANQPNARMAGDGVVDVAGHVMMVWHGETDGWLVHVISIGVPVTDADLVDVPRPSPHDVPDYS